MIVTVAEETFHWQLPLDERLRTFDAQGIFNDIDTFQAHYLNRRGLFLVVLDDGRVVGSGAVRQIDERVCELKRIWLIEAYRGKRIGFQVVQKLFDFARQAGYTTVRLTTDKRQTRALDFYRQLGFHLIASSSDDPDDVMMEMLLERIPA